MFQCVISLSCSNVSCFDLSYYNLSCFNLSCSSFSRSSISYFSSFSDRHGRVHPSQTQYHVACTVQCSMDGKRVVWRLIARGYVTRLSSLGCSRTPRLVCGMPEPSPTHTSFDWYSTTDKAANIWGGIPKVSYSCNPFLNASATRIFYTTLVFRYRLSVYFEVCVS